SGTEVFSQMPFTSEALKRLVPAFSLSLIRVDDTCAPTTHYSEHFDEFSHQLFASAGHVFSARSDDPAAFGNLLRGARPFGTLIGGGEAFVGGATYQHLFKRNGIHHVLDLALRDGGGPIGILGIFREREAPAFTRADLVHVAAFYPWLVHALRAEPGGERVFDEVDSAMLVASVTGRIEFASLIARDWLQDAFSGAARGRLLEEGLLPDVIRRLCEQASQVRRADPGRTRSVAPPTLTLPVTGGRLRLRAYPLHDGPGHERFGVQLSLEVDRTVRLLKAFDACALPPQLARLALAMWRGLEPEAICRELAITPATFKSYRKDLYARLSVVSRQTLLDRLAALANSTALELSRHLPRRAPAM
ncbi:MAG: hypothetical protein MUC96_34300, partial [Myxococcaceae bacterium]|nr:hypothetical protein [Myxococcaceae bacterium]